MSSSPRVLLVGPLPPPSAGMANQTRQLKRLLETEGVTVDIIQTNAPYRPAWVSAVRGLRAVFRLLPYMRRILSQAGQADVVHVMANSGWAWHLFAAPAIWLAAIRGTPVVVNYRGGLAGEFLTSKAPFVRRTLSSVAELVVPSRFLQEVFAGHGIRATIIRNVVDVEMFRPLEKRPPRASDAPHVVVARNLERLYGNDLAIHTLARLRCRFPAARLTVAGSGPELKSLRSLVDELGLAEAVHFPGRLDTAQMVALYQSADIVLNPSRADNTPNSILEAVACGVPVVSTDVGGVPSLVEHGRTAWLVRPEAPDEMADGIGRVLDDPELRRALVANGLTLAQQCSWPDIKERWLGLYRRLAQSKNSQRGASSDKFDIYTRICSAGIFPLHERLKRHRSVALRREIEKTQWWSTDHLRGETERRLRDFLVEAGQRVPYYRRLFSSVGFDPRTVCSLEDLQALPFLKKSTIRENTEQLKSDRAGTLIRYSTGGSSGEPLVFYMGMDRVSHDVAAKWRATRWWGVDIGDVEVVLWGSPIEIGRQDRIRALRDRIFRSFLLPAFHMSETQIDSYLATIARRRPRMLFGYASVIALLATHAERSGRQMHGIGLKVAFTTGETLYPEQRAVIERVFGAPVANGYGSRDAGFIAHQCPRGSLHLSAEHIIVELVDEAGRPVGLGEMGEIVTTHLASADFPFIRYRTGDMAVLGTEPCPCGRGLPVLREVLGRTTDFVRTAMGNTMHALALIYEVRDRPGVRAFKFIQEADLSLELLLVGGPELTSDVEARIRRGIVARMGDAVALTIRRVDEIPPEKSGKYRYVVSKASAPVAEQR